MKLYPSVLIHCVCPMTYRMLSRSTDYSSENCVLLNYSVSIQSSNQWADPCPHYAKQRIKKKKKKNTGPNNCAELYEYDLFCPKLSRPHFLPDFCNCPYSTTLILFVYFRSVQQSLSSPPDVWIASPRVFYFSSALSKSATALEREGLDVSVSR